MWYVDKKLSYWNFITYIQCTADLWEHLVGVFTVSSHIFKVLFNNYDVTTLKIIHPMTFRNYAKHPIKVLWNKNNIMYMQRFYKTVPRSPSEYFCTECF